MEIFQKNLKELVLSKNINDNPFEEDNYDYHSIVGDVVVSYSMSEEQIEKQKKVRENWLQCYNIYNDKSISVDMRIEKIKSILSDFEFSQCKLSHFSLLGNHFEMPVDLTYNIPDIQYKLHLIGIGHLREFLESIINSRIIKIPQIQRIKKYDRSGKVASALQSSLDNHVYYNMYFNENCLFQSDGYQDPESKVKYETFLYKVDKETNIKTIVKLFVPKRNLSESFSFMYFEGNDKYSPYKRFEYISFDMAECINKFNNKFYELTGKEYPQKDPFLPTDGFFGQLPCNKAPTIRIPKLSKILFGALRQNILISPEKIDSYIDKLPDSLLEEFIFDCLNDNTPNGFDSLSIVLSKIRNRSIKKPSDFQIINSAIEHDHWFAFSFEKEISQSIFVPTYNNSFKMNVYDNYDKFILKEWKPISDNDYIFEIPNKLDLGSPSIVTKDEFKQNFKIYSKDVINDDFDWSNTVVAGSTLTACLTGDMEKHESGDINVFFYGIDRVEITSKILKYYSSLPIHSKPTIVHNFKNIISICCHYPYRNITFQLEPYISIEHILVTCDINSCTFAYDGTEVYGLYRSMEAMNFRANVVSQYLWMIHGDIHFQNRMVKYFERGFSVISPEYDFFIDNEDFHPHFSNTGLTLLASGARDQNIYDFLKNPFANVPYGPDFNKENLEKKLSQDNRFNLVPHYDLGAVCCDSQIKRKFTSMSSNVGSFINIGPRYDSLL
ncbi:hypothetical protein PPL_06098 [Heterostelium album PN500]|uniref:Uncharacterized protein n=1 Tax=Heterostelium pallidum (strain ATCC 26659 / Pp 5 / PN500) TaxID=670386 RepID=D3BC76_HETP5|nr:hypothetical protein PPL_06098 [Heterostelium album PN500]EFA81259.1 hypothetical protein PPL_06098 [Heterostelium album PN500]|eukprot:XP_020433377.1 hypothetical protein PPL_06098 [Heterostelium album PN500]